MSDNTVNGEPHKDEYRVARKLSGNGDIHYQMKEDQGKFSFRIFKNPNVKPDKNGTIFQNFDPSWVTLSSISDCLKKHESKAKATPTFSSEAMEEVYSIHRQNSPGFLAAILMDQGLIEFAKPHIDVMEDYHKDKKINIGGLCLALAMPVDDFEKHLRTN